MSRDALSEHFSLIGVSASPACLDKCVDLCVSHGISEEELVETWISFSVSAQEDGLDPTPELLAAMERRELSKHHQHNTSSSSSSNTGGLVIYAQPQQDDDPSDGCGGDRIVQLYAAATSTKGTPERRGVAKGPAFSPASFSPSSVTPSSTYSSRTNSGSVVCSFPEDGDAGGSWDVAAGGHPVVVTRLDPAPPYQEYMFDDLGHKAQALDDLVEEACEALARSRGLEELCDPLRRSVEEDWAVGRVACEPGGRLHPNSALLECSRGLGGGRTVHLDLSLLQSYALFPGQLVAVRGVNHTGRAFRVSQLVTDFSRQLLGEPPPCPSSAPPLELVVAAGPYTQADTMLYQPLQDLVRRLEESSPHLALLCGPFIDDRHPHVAQGALAETLDDVFQRIIDGLATALQHGRTQVVLVPSHRDAHHLPVYPTPPLTPRRALPSVHLVPDPCVLSLGGFEVAATSVDVLMHLSKEELEHPPRSPDRLGRLAGHVLSQASFYPLCPPPEDLPLDLCARKDLCRLQRRPHLLVLPSDLRFFIKEVDGCVVVNPGRLAKGMAGGTMARLQVAQGRVTRAQVVKI